MIRSALFLTKADWQALDDALDSMAQIDKVCGIDCHDFRALRDKIRGAIEAGDRVILCPDAVVYVREPSLQPPADLAAGWDGYHVEFRADYSPHSTPLTDSPLATSLAGSSLVYEIWSALDTDCHVRAIPKRLRERGYDGEHGDLLASVRNALSAHRAQYFRQVSFGVWGRQRDVAPPRRGRALRG